MRLGQSQGSAIGRRLRPISIPRLDWTAQRGVCPVLSYGIEGSEGRHGRRCDIWAVFTRNGNKQRRIHLQLLSLMLVLRTRERMTAGLPRRDFPIEANPELQWMKCARLTRRILSGTINSRDNLRRKKKPNLTKATFERLRTVHSLQ